jgi:hypothetical protein
MGNKLTHYEHLTGTMMLEAIQEDSAEKVEKAYKVALNERVVSREEEREKGLTEADIHQMKQESMLNYLSRQYNMEKGWLGRFRKHTFVECCYWLGFNARAKQVQRLLNDHRLSMGLEIDPIKLESQKSGRAVDKGSGETHLSSTGQDAKSKLEAWIAKNNAAKNPTSSKSTAIMNKLKAGGD